MAGPAADWGDRPRGLQRPRGVGIALVFASGLAVGLLISAAGDFRSPAALVCGEVDAGESAGAAGLAERSEAIRPLALSTNRFPAGTGESVDQADVAAWKEWLTRLDAQERGPLRSLLLRHLDTLLEDSVAQRLLDEHVPLDTADLRELGGPGKVLPRLYDIAFSAQSLPPEGPAVVSSVTTAPRSPYLGTEPDVTKGSEDLYVNLDFLNRADEAVLLKVVSGDGSIRNFQKLPMDPWNGENFIRLNAARLQGEVRVEVYALTPGLPLLVQHRVRVGL